MAKKVYEEENIRAIADKIREKTGGDTTYKTSQMPEGVESVYEAGQKAEYDMFWDNFQQNGTRRNYPYGFAGSCWNNNTYNPKYEIIVTSMATFTFAFNSVITSTKVPIDIDTATSGSFFAGCTRLKEIPSIKVTEKVSFSSWFTNCTALETINFTEDSVIANNINFSESTKLTHDSLMSIINALKDFRTYKTYTYNGSMAYDNVTVCPDFYSTITVTSNYSDDYNLRLSGVDENNKEKSIEIYIPNGTTDEFYHLAECPLADLEIKTFSCQPAEGAEDIALEYEFTYIKPYIEPTVNKTLTLHADAKARLTEDELKIATDKGWTVI